jgi:hypothetical protein
MHCKRNTDTSTDYKAMYVSFQVEPPSITSPLVNSPFSIASRFLVQRLHVPMQPKPRHTPTNLISELYEKVARTSISNNLMRWSVKEYLLKAGICQLCTGDIVGVNAAMDKYRDLDPSFTQQREHQLLVDLATAVQEGDQEMFADKLFQYDQLSKLDKWKTTLLLRVKGAIEETGEDFS